MILSLVKRKYVIEQCKWRSKSIGIAFAGMSISQDKLTSNRSERRMTSTWNQLQTAFVDDHVAMTRGYRDLLEAVQAGDFGSASRIASTLDEIAGPHIEFEEQCLYPEVKESRGETYTTRLYDEHAEVLGAIVELQSLPEDARPTDERVAQWKEQLQHGLDHAAACGSLLSHLGAQSVEQQQARFDELIRFRRQGHRWSELHPMAEKQD